MLKLEHLVLRQLQAVLRAARSLQVLLRLAAMVSLAMDALLVLVHPLLAMVMLLALEVRLEVLAAEVQHQAPVRLIPPCSKSLR